MRKLTILARQFNIVVMENPALKKIVADGVDPRFILNHFSDEELIKELQQRHIERKHAGSKTELLPVESCGTVIA